ncbi:hypothetical protein PO909_023441 [Leuciscus waleckii]
MALALALALALDRMALALALALDRMALALALDRMALALALALDRMAQLNWAERHDNDPKHTARMTTALLRKLKVMEWPSMSPDLNPFEHLWGILKQKAEKSHVSNSQQLRDVIMEEWKRIPATTCAALVNSMPRRSKAVLDNNGSHTKC